MHLPRRLLKKVALFSEHALTINGTLFTTMLKLSRASKHSKAQSMSRAGLVKRSVRLNNFLKPVAN